MSLYDGRQWYLQAQISTHRTDQDLNNLGPILTTTICCTRAVSYRFHQANVCARTVSYGFHSANQTVPSARNVSGAYLPQTIYCRSCNRNLTCPICAKNVTSLETVCPKICCTTRKVYNILQNSVETLRYVRRWIRAVYTTRNVDTILQKSLQTDVSEHVLYNTNNIYHVTKVYRQHCISMPEDMLYNTCTTCYKKIGCAAQKVYTMLQKSYRQ